MRHLRPPLRRVQSILRLFELVLPEIESEFAHSSNSATQLKPKNS